jgi:hypothetical protein
MAMVQGSETADVAQPSAIARQYETFLGQLSVKDLASVQRHDERCAAEGADGLHTLWKRLAGDMGRLAGHAAEALGQVVLKFYIADGKYKQQVFALEATRPGTIGVYLPDVVQGALRQKIMAAGSAAHQYKVRGASGQVELLPIDAETKDLTACKGMVGWGRRALRVEMSVQTPEGHVRAVERMCALAAEGWPVQKRDLSRAGPAGNTKK